MLRKVLIAGFILLVNVAPSFGDILLTENFNYANGNLVPNGGWTAHSGAGANPVQVVSNAIILSQGAGSREDVSRALGATLGSGTTFTYTFDVAVNGSAAATTMYFAHLQSSSSNFASRLFVAPDGASTTSFLFGLANSGSAPNVVSGPFNYGTTNNILVTYNFDTFQSSLSVNGSALITTNDGVTVALPVNAMGFRQAAGNTSMTIDNLVVSRDISAVPEPTSIALLSVAGFTGLVVTYRRRKARKSAAV